MNVVVIVMQRWATVDLVSVTPEDHLLPDHCLPFFSLSFPIFRIWGIKSAYDWKIIYKIRHCNVIMYVFVLSCNNAWKNRCFRKWNI